MTSTMSGRPDLVWTSSDDDSSSSSSHAATPTHSHDHHSRYEFHRNMFGVQFLLFCGLMTLFMFIWDNPLFIVKHPDLLAERGSSNVTTMLSLLRLYPSYDDNDHDANTSSSKLTINESATPTAAPSYYCPTLQASGHCSIACAAIEGPLSSLFSILFYPTLCAFAFLSKALVRVGLYVCCGGCKAEYEMKNEKKDPCFCRCCPPRLLFWYYLQIFFYAVSWVPTQIHLAVILRVFTKQGLCVPEGGDAFQNISLANDPAEIRMSWSFALLVLFDITLTVTIVLLVISILSFAGDLKRKKELRKRQEEIGEAERGGTMPENTNHHHSPQINCQNGDGNALVATPLSPRCPFTIVRREEEEATSIAPASGSTPSYYRSQRFKKNPNAASAFSTAVSETPQPRQSPPPGHPPPRLMLNTHHGMNYHPQARQYSGCPLPSSTNNSYPNTTARVQPPTQRDSYYCGSSSRIPSNPWTFPNGRTTQGDNNLPRPRQHLL